MSTVQKYAERTFQTGSLLVGLAVMFLPLAFVYRFQVERSASHGPGDVEVAVGVAVMLRTAFRRLLRAGTTNLLRTSLGAFSRTSARTLTRRLARVSARVLLRVLTVPSHTMSTVAPEANSGMLSWLSIGLGFVALALSFAFVALQQSPAAHAELLTGGPQGRYTITELSVLAAFPLVVYAAAAYGVARKCGARIRVNTALDGLLLQAYFAGAGSFLPMTTDIEYEAAERTQFRISTVVLLILYVSHLALHWSATAFDLPTASTLSAFLLIYCFVYSFPIRPLEGFFVWKGSKAVWLLLCVPILVSFLTWLPAVFLDVL